MTDHKQTSPILTEGEYAEHLAIMDAKADLSMEGSYQPPNLVKTSDAATDQVQQMNDLVFAATGQEVAAQDIQTSQAPLVRIEKQPVTPVEQQSAEPDNLAALALTDHPFNADATPTAIENSVPEPAVVESEIIDEREEAQEAPVQQPDIINDILASQLNKTTEPKDTEPKAEEDIDKPVSQADTDAQLAELNAQFDLAEQGGTSTPAPVEDYPADASDLNQANNQYENEMQQPSAESRPMKEVPFSAVDDRSPGHYGLQSAPNQPAGGAYPMQSQETLGAAVANGLTSFIGGISSAVFSAASQLVQSKPKPLNEPSQPAPETNPIASAPDNAINTTPMNNTVAANDDFSAFFDSRFENKLGRLADMSQTHSSVLDVFKESELFKFAELNKDLQDPQQLSEAKQRISTLAEDHGTKEILQSMVNINTNINELMDEINEDYADDPEKLAKMNELVTGWKDKYQQTMDKLDDLPLLDDVMASLKESINKLLDTLKGAMSKVATVMK